MTESKLIWKTFIYTCLVFFSIGILLSNMSYVRNNQDLKKNISGYKEILPKLNERLCKLENTTGIGNPSYTHFMDNLERGDLKELDNKVNELPDNLTDLQYQQEVELHGLQHYALSDESYIYPITIKDTFITSEMGQREVTWSPNHTGVDLKNDRSLNIFCPKSGIVIDKGYDASSDGHFVVIQHTITERSLLCHAYQFTIKKGDKVNQGQDIGIEGNTGVSTGQHLHWTRLQLIDGRWLIVNPVKNSTYNKRVSHGMGWGQRGWYYF